MDADVTVARQLVDAYCDALEQGDSEAQDYAEEQLADFVDEIDDATPDEVLVALLDLPLDAATLALLNEVSAKLGRRGPGAAASSVCETWSRWPGLSGRCSRPRPATPTPHHVPITPARCSTPCPRAT